MASQKSDIVSASTTRKYWKRSDNS